MFVLRRMVGINAFARNALVRHCSSQGAEARLETILKDTFPQATLVKASDISGGCGAMYEITVATGEFKGLSKVKQHRKITQALASEIKDMHGLRINTMLPEKED